MTDYWPSKAGVKLLAQLDNAFPHRDRASDGWIGDASHAAVVSDHNPCWSCPGDRYGVVRARDFDASFGGNAGYNSTKESWAFAQDLRHAMLAGDSRISYIIAWDNDRKADFICSMNPGYQPLGVWRPYTGDSHQNHVHVSFTADGDFRDHAFDLPSLNPAPTVDPALKRRKSNLHDRIHKLRNMLAATVRKIKRQRG